MAHNLLDEPSLFESEDEDDAAPGEDKDQQLRREIKNMLYGFGDVKEPLSETIEELTKIIIDYITSVCQKAASMNPNKKVAIDEIFYLLRRDSRKFSRVKELLTMSKELKDARKGFENGNPTNFQ